MRVDTTLNRELTAKLKVIAEHHNLSLANTLRMLIDSYPTNRSHVKDEPKNEDIQR